MLCKLTTQEIIDSYKGLILAMRADGKGRVAIAKTLSEKSGRSVKPGAVQHAMKKLGVYHLTGERPKPIHVTEEESDVGLEERTIGELIQSRIQASERKARRFSKHNRKLTLPAEPRGIICLGDPHVDNEGCDFKQLYDDVKLMQSTEGILASCVGDMQDHWVGRMGRLYAESSATAKDGWMLSEWLLKSMQFIALVGGNHDSWSQVPGHDPYTWLTRACGVMTYAPDELRLTLHWKDHPDLEPVVWILRHDFKGRSWFHPTHGPMKEGLLDGRAHLLTAGHIHSWGQLTTEHRHQRVTHAIRVRGYKRNDSYAKEKGFHEQDYGASVLIVIDPKDEGPGRISVFWDLEKGCEFLTHLREMREVGAE